MKRHLLATVLLLFSGSYIATLPADEKPVAEKKTPAPSAAPSVTMQNALNTPVMRLARLQIVYEGDDFAYQCSEGLDVFREYDPGATTVVLRLIGYAPGKYEVTAVSCKAGKLSPFAKCVITVEGTVPPPGPGPPPVPPVPPGPVPIPTTGLKVMLIYETADLEKLPPKQLSIINAKPIRDYLNAKTVPTTDGGKRGWYFTDQNTDFSGESKTWQDAIRRPRSQVPWLIISNGTSGYEGPLPADVTATLELLKKYGN